MMYSLKVVIFDHTVLFSKQENLRLKIKNMLLDLKTAGLKIVIFSTATQDFSALCAAHGYPDPDYFVCESVVKAPKGSPKWIEAVSGALGIVRQEILYVGDDEQDWRTALNGGVTYLHAEWAKPMPGKAMIAVIIPKQVLIYASHFLMKHPGWQYSLDVPGHNLHVRHLMNANTELPASSKEYFKAIDIFKAKEDMENGKIPPEHGRYIKVLSAYAGNLLVIHALTGLHLEGLILPNCIYTIYPGHMPGSINYDLQYFLSKAAALFKGYYRPDLFLRKIEAPDTSRARFEASHGGPRFDMNIKVQSDTLCLNSKYEKFIKKRRIIVFDDFSTTGTSLEWAKLLLQSAKASSIIVVTIGKYGRNVFNHDLHSLKIPFAIFPFEMIDYDISKFNVSIRSLEVDNSVPDKLKGMFRYWKSHLPYLPNLENYLSYNERTRS